MNPSATAKGNRAFTLVELLVIIAAVIVVWWLSVQPIYSPAKVKKAQLVVCLNNLRQIGIAVMIYHQDNSNQPPWNVSLIESGVAADCFFKLSPYLPSPTAFICPSDESRSAAPTNFAGFSNGNLSYFATPNIPFTMTSNLAFMVLAGDRHLAFNHQPVKSGLFSITNPGAMSWTRELHAEADAKQAVGLLLFSDAHVARTKAKELPDVLAKQALATTRLVIP